jgi:hypothetical protein
MLFIDHANAQFLNSMLLNEGVRADESPDASLRRYRLDAPFLRALSEPSSNATSIPNGFNNRDSTEKCCSAKISVGASRAP